MREWIVVAYSAVKGTRTEKSLFNWGLSDALRRTPCKCTSRSLRVVMGTNKHNLNFPAGHDLGNAVYSQLLKHIMSESQWTRMFGDHAGVSDERAGDAVEIYCAILYFATVYPYEFATWWDPQEGYAGMEHSLRSLAAITGRIGTSQFFSMDLFPLPCWRGCGRALRPASRLTKSTGANAMTSSGPAPDLARDCSCLLQCCLANRLLHRRGQHTPPAR